MKDYNYLAAACGERKTPGHISGFANRFQNVEIPQFFTLWLKARQRNIFLQASHNKFGNSPFFFSFNMVLLYLRQRQNLTPATRLNALKFAHNFRNSMGICSKCSIKSEIEIDLHITERRPNSALFDFWWTLLLFPILLRQLPDLCKSIRSRSQHREHFWLPVKHLCFMQLVGVIPFQNVKQRFWTVQSESFRTSVVVRDPYRKCNSTKIWSLFSSKNSLRYSRRPQPDQEKCYQILRQLFHRLW